MRARSKSLTRIYFPDTIPDHGECRLAPDKAHHLTHVLRLQPGDAVTLFDGHGAEYTATVARMAKAGVVLNVGACSSVDRESPLAVVLAQAISSGERMDYTVQKAVELGAAGIQPLTSERSVVRLDSARAGRRLAHWQGVAIAACEQCGRNFVPVVRPVMTLRDWLAGFAASPTGVGILLDPEAPTALREIGRPVAATLLSGPEGGWTPAEQGDARRAGFTPVRLGPRVLRTETAAIAAMAAIQALWGDF